MLDHVSVRVSDVEASAALHLRLFASCSLREAVRFPAGPSFVVGFAGPDGVPQLWLSPAGGTETRELHLAISAPDRPAVDAVHAAATAAGVQIPHAPREWPEDHRGYWAVSLRDLDGHNVEAVHHGR